MIIIPSDIEGCPMTEVIAMARSTESGTWLLMMRTMMMRRRRRTVKMRIVDYPDECDLC